MFDCLSILFSTLDYCNDILTCMSLQNQLHLAVVKEDYEEAARIKVAIAAAATNDTVGRVMSQLNVRE